MRLFFSYAQSDEPFRHQLAKHLSLLKREGILDTWDAYEITAGTDRAQAIETHLNTADIILLLISADFIASDRYDTEMQSAIARHEKNEAQVIPILLRPCDWESAPFGKLQPLPRGGTPITSCKDSEAALAEIAQEIRWVAIKLNPALAKTPKSPLKPSAPFPGVRLPENFVPRAEAFDAVKQKLLADDDRALVVSAIAGLGGLGKSVLAAALVLDAEVQARFEDGILWVTLGQNPDLQNLLGDWIRTLDKSRESYSATTLEAASSYLRSLLIEKRMLLVVDDAWNGVHVEHFRVGGAECRVLVTTREAQIDGAEYHALGLMSEAEAIALVRQKLKQRWKPEQEVEVKAFAKSLGYLPLALDLAANQVRDGLSWGELRSEFEAERRAVALEVLNSSEAWDCLDEQQQRKYSLRACFNLSLRRLTAEQLRQFAWLGVLPEDVSIDGRMAMTLWDLPRLQAKRGLLLLRSRSLLTIGTETLEGEPSYRVHDLMHDVARGLIEQGTLVSSISTLAAAQAHLLDRYRQQTQGRWNRLPNDGYIHRHLTWHLVQAGMEDEIHALMAMSDERGRNAWFEACERLGQPAIFVQDVARGWEVAEQGYEQDNTRSIVLQCRYALVAATLNSLVGNLPIEMMARFVKRQYWTPEQAWAYVEQIQDEEKVSEAIRELAPYLTKVMFRVAVEKARSIQNEFSRAGVLSALTQIDTAYFAEALDAARLIQDKSSRAGVLSALAQIDTAYFAEALDAARLIQNESSRTEVLSALAQIDTADFAQLLDAARSIQDESRRAKVLNALAQIDTVDFAQLLDAARSIQSEFQRAEVLSALAQIDTANFAQLWDAARSIQNESRRAEVLSALAQIDTADFAQLLDMVRSIQDEYAYSKSLLRAMAYYSDSPVNVLRAFRVISEGHENCFAFFLSDLACTDSISVMEAIEFIQTIQSQLDCALALGELSCKHPQVIPIALQAAYAIQSDSERNLAVKGLINNLPLKLLPQFFELANSIEDSQLREEILSKALQRQSSSKQIVKQSLAAELQSLEAITNKVNQAEELYCLLPRLPLSILPLKRWTFCLHILAHRTRADLMQDLATLHPAIVHLGGKEAIRGMVDAMRDVCSQWK